MRVLAIETATASSSVALSEDDQVVAAARRVDRRGHVGFLVGALDFCFSQAGWSPGEVDVVAVDVGPGLFSGIRTGLATAQAVAAAIGAPLVPVSSIDVVALRAATGHRRIWSVVDVRRSEFAVCPYEPVPGGVVRDGAVELVSAQAFRAMVQSDPAEILVVGDWPALPDETLRGLNGVKTGRPRYPDAAAAAEVAHGRAERDEVPAASDVRPAYMREPDVRINWSDYRSEGPWS